MREEVSERKEMGAWRWVRQGRGRGEGIGRRGGRSRGRWGSRGSGEALPGSGRARGGGQGMRGREIDGESRGLGLEGLGGPWEAGLGSGLRLAMAGEVGYEEAGRFGWSGLRGLAGLSLSTLLLTENWKKGKERRKGLEEEFGHAGNFPELTKMSLNQENRSGHDRKFNFKLI